MIWWTSDNVWKENERSESEADFMPAKPALQSKNRLPSDLSKAKKPKIHNPKTSMFPDLVHSGPTWAFILSGASGVVWGAIVSFLWHSPQFLSE